MTSHTLYYTRGVRYGKKRWQGTSKSVRQGKGRQELSWRRETCLYHNIGGGGNNLVWKSPGQDSVGASHLYTFPYYLL